VVLAQLVAAGDGTVTERLIAVRLGSDDRIYFYSSHAAREAVADILAAADDWEAALVAEKQPRARYGGETSSPEDLIDAAVSENRAAVEGEILKKALSLTPTGFENLVIALLEAMGYGRAGSIQRTSATGDAGIDGIISQDPLGLDRIYVQAKRYATDRTVDRPLGKQGDRGVFITTSRFSPGAVNEAERINARIELIDGARLAELLVRHRVGVQTVQTVDLYRLDEDFFD
jgi:restriction system protein